MVKDLEGKPCGEWLRSLGLFRLEKKRLRADVTGVFNIFTRGRGGAGSHLFALVTSDRTQGNGMK